MLSQIGVLRLANLGHSQPYDKLQSHKFTWQDATVKFLISLAKLVIVIFQSS